MRKTLWIFVLLVFVPRANGDSFQVTSGVFQPFGATGENLSLSGNGFTATGNINIGPGACWPDYLPGDPIKGCAGINWVGGGIVTIKHDGVSEQVGYGFDFMIGISQADMFLSGATQATLSEAASFGTLTGCVDEIHFPDCTRISLVFPQDVWFTISLVQDPLSGGYNVTSETYAFTTPEPDTGVLLLTGVGLFGFVTRKHFRKTMVGVRLCS
jgi:hypothetical protein